MEIRHAAVQHREKQKAVPDPGAAAAEYDAMDIVRLMDTVQLDLTSHCIETEIKRIHNHAVSAYFKTAKDKESIEETISLTQNALASIDFAKLRAQYPPLAGNTNLHAVLSMDNAIVALFLDGKPVVLTTR